MDRPLSMHLARFVVTVLVVLPPVILAQPKGPVGDDGALEHLDVPRRLGEREGPLDWALARVPSGKDRFVTEKIHDRLALRLREWADELRRSAPRAAPETESDLYARAFSATDPSPPPFVLRLSKNGLTVERAAFSGEVSTRLDAGDFAAALGEQLAWLGPVRDLQFKVFRIEESPGEPPRTSVRVLVEAAARDRPDPRQWRAVWDLEWSTDADRCQLTRVVAVSFERAAWTQRPFAEVTEAALGHNDCFREQLQVGLDDWRRRLDAASGIDVYGHQGISVGDYDGDGWDDFYVAQPAGLPNRLFRNRGDGTFEDRTSTAGLGVLDATGGSIFVDLDGDLDLDLVVVTGAEALIFENRGRGEFRRRESAGVELTAREGASLMGCAVSDYDRDGDLDLYLYSYLFWAGAGAKTQISYPYPYHDANNGAPNFLFRNEGRYRFVDVTRASGMDAANRRFSFAASWCDYDGDGDPDLYVANDFGRNNLYRNRGDGTFDEVAAEAGVVDIANGMSVTWRDYNGDGLFDLYVGNMWSAAGRRLADGIPGRPGARLAAVYRRMARGNSLFRNRGDGTFEDVSIESGAYFGRWSWSSQFTDFDGDGRQDLYVVNGFVSNSSRDDL